MLSLDNAYGECTTVFYIRRLAFVAHVHSFISQSHLLHRHLPGSHVLIIMPQFASATSARALSLSLLFALLCVPSYANSIAYGRVADCPSGYTNNGFTCGRGSHDIRAPSHVANCPSGYTNIGLLCSRGASSYGKGCTTIFKKYGCRSGYSDAGCFCLRHVSILTSSSMSCRTGYFLNKNLGRCYKNCPSGYTNTGEFCHRPVSTLSMGSMTCHSNEKRISSRCYPKL